MKLVSLIIDLNLVSGKRTDPLQESINAHAAVLKLLSLQDEQLAKRVHDGGRHRVFTLAMLKGQMGDKGFLRMTFFDPNGLNLVERVVNTLNMTATLCLGAAEWRIRGISLSDPPWARIATLDEILAELFNHSIRFWFATPTAIHRKYNHRERFADIMPTPERVFGSLSRRWTDVIGTRLPDGFDTWIGNGGCIVSNLRLISTSSTLPERTQKGFEGWVDYTCRDMTAQYVAAFNHLSRLAHFTGVGCQTARGMGAVRTEPAREKVGS